MNFKTNINTDSKGEKEKENNNSLNKNISDYNNSDEGSSLTSKDKHYNSYKNKTEEKTIIVYGEDKTTKLILKALHNSKDKWDNYANSEGPTIAMGI